MQENNILFKRGRGPQVDEHTLLLVHPQGGVIRDLTGRATVANNGMTIDTGDRLFDSSTIAAPGGGKYLTVPNPTYMALGTQDFTFDTYFNITSIPSISGSTIWPFFTWGNWNAGSQPYNFAQWYAENLNGFTSIQVWQYLDANTSHNIGNPPGGPVTKTTWHHYAFQRKANTWQMFLDGHPLAAAAADSANYIVHTARDLYIGALLGGVSGNVLWTAPGKFAFFRYSNIARFEQSFDPFAY
jgi:hypothetical protein